MFSLANTQAPDRADWLALYEAAAEFKRQKSWEWLSEEHLFGVQNPYGGEIGYCCILGRLGEVTALNVYPGAEGLASLLRMQDYGPGDPFDFIAIQKCLMASYDDRDQLDPSSLKLIKELGLKFRGAGEWPNFLSYEPGYVPWRLTSREQVRFLTVCLQQSVRLADKYRDRADDLLAGDEGELLVLVPDRNPAAPAWREERMIPPGIDEALRTSIRPAAIIDELRVSRLLKRIKGRANVWEADSFFAPLPIEHGDRPYYPRLALIVDQETEQIIHYRMSQGPGENIDLAEELLQIMEQYQVMPQEIWTVREELCDQLEPLLQACGIELAYVDELPVLKEARDGMFEFFGGR